MRSFLIVTSAVAGLIVFACSDFGGDDTPASGPPAPEVDGSTPTDALVIAETSPPIAQACTEKPFGTPKPVKGVPFGSTCLMLSHDEKTAYYTLANVIYSAPWSFADGVGNPQVPLQVASAGGLGCLAFTADDNTGFFEDTFHVNRQRRLDGGAFGEAVGIGAEDLPDAGAILLGRPFVDRVTSELYVQAYGLDYFDGGPIIIAKTTLSPDGTQRKFKPFPVPDDPWAQSPVLSADSLSLYYASAKRDDGKGHNAKDVDMDIWVTTRVDNASTFGPGTRLTSVSSVGHGEEPTYISNDGCTLLLASGRDEAGTTQFRSSYIATRTP